MYIHTYVCVCKYIYTCVYLKHISVCRCFSITSQISINLKSFVRKNSEKETPKGDKYHREQVKISDVGKLATSTKIRKISPFYRRRTLSALRRILPRLENSVLLGNYSIILSRIHHGCRTDNLPLIKVA